VEIDFLVGAHLSLGKSPRLCLQEAAAHGVRCMQIFASSPGAWKPPILPDLKVDELKAARSELRVNPMFIHAIYLINLASADRVLVGRGKGSLTATMRAGSVMGAAGVITHIGSHGGRGFSEVAQQVADALVAVLHATPDDIDLVLENSAGAGGIVGSSLEELGELLDRAGRPARLKVALDTAHLCGAGWDFSPPESAARLVTSVAQSIGLERLVVIHANDSRAPVGSRRDRHANIGEGHVGAAGFRSLLQQKELTSVPWILETPDLDSRLDDGQRFGSVETLLRLAVEAGKEFSP
jgi:deoxyribonuclease-4